MKNRTLVYCRESRDDYGLDYERIETQRDLLLRYCRENNLVVVDVIMDDDETGTNFNRYEEVRRRVLNKEFDIILFKNSARLGRNQKESLIFADFLEEHGIEIRFEDEKYDEESFGLLAWFNERRARDDSKNIRRNLKEKIEQGKLIVKPIYGYDAVNKKLVVNEKTAEVVKLIFDLYVNKGWGFNRIAKYLNTQSHKTPSEERNYVNTPKTNIWSVQHVMRIIRDIRYTGSYLGGTTEKISFKTKKTRRKPKEEWVIIPNMHEAIISMDLWEKAQRLAEQRNYYKEPRTINKENNRFSGVLYCGKCGATMYRRKVKNRKDVYICKKYWKEGKENPNIREGYGCTSHSTNADLLDNFVNLFMNELLINKEVKKYIVENIRCLDVDKIGLEKKILKLKEQRNNISDKLSRIYDDKLNKIIPEFLFVEKSKDLEKELNEIEENLRNIIHKLENSKGVNNKEAIVCQTIEKLKKNGISKDDVRKLIKKIIVFEPNEIKEIHKKEYGLSDEIYNKILENGGLAVQLNFLYQFTISYRRM